MKVKVISNLKNILLFLSSFFIYIVLIELGLRIIYFRSMDLNMEMMKYSSLLKVNTKESLPGHKHLANKEVFLMGVNVKTNKDGLRDEKEIKSKPNSYKIAFIGDSFVFGWGVKYEETIGKLIENKLNDILSCDKEIEVFNLGVGNYNSSQQLALFNELKEKLNPDLVILQHFINDAEPYVKEKVNLFLKKSYLFNLIKSRILMKRKGSYIKYYDSLYRDKTWNGNKLSIQRLNKEAAKISGKNLVTFLLPELREINNISNLKDAYELRKDFFVKENIRHYDLRPFLDKVSKGDESSLWVSKEDSHSNAYTNELISTFISNNIYIEIGKSCNNEDSFKVKM